MDPTMFLAMMAAALLGMLSITHLYKRRVHVGPTQGVPENIITTKKSYLPEIEAFTTELEHKQRKYIEGELKHSEQYRTLIAIIPDVVYVLSPEGFFEFVQNAEQMGWDAEHLIGKHFSTILRADYAEKVSRRFILREYKGQKTEPNQPGLFDERRGPPRVTRRLPVVLIPEGWVAEKQPGKCAYVSACGMVHSGGLWDKPLRARVASFVGTIGIIEITGATIWENGDSAKRK